MPQQPRLCHLQSLGPHGFHQIAYTEWGDPHNSHLVVCVHGLTRNSRDFDVLAAALSDKCRVVCMDVAGRGASEWLKHKGDYSFPLYLSDAAALLARITAYGPESRVGRIFRRASHSIKPRIDWIGTSMGGLIGMMLAAKPATPIRRLVLNDVGPLVPWPALTRLKNTHQPELGKKFASLKEVETHLREVCAPFGPLTDDQWRHVAHHSAQRKPDGSFILNYDPAIASSQGARSFSGITFGNGLLAGVDLWPMWDMVKCPTLVIRGSESDVLLPQIAAEMAKRGPQAKIVEFEGIGHAPWLMSRDQIAVIREFLLAPSID
jgi:pimeloyl-ACP methyl ester carboxylesterase